MNENNVDLIPEEPVEAQPVVEEEARSPYFAPRRLGATAPHDCSIWSVDYRDVGDTPANPTRTLTDVRLLEDETLTDQLQILMDAGMRVRV
jgi:hypothetical protein